MIDCSFNGRIGKDGARVINGQKGDFLSMDMATDIFAGGENRAMWVRVKSSSPNIIKMAEWFKKGRLIKVVGEIRREPEAWDGKDGKPHAMLVITATKIEFVNSGRKKDDNSVEQHPSVKTQETEKPYEVPDEKADDLPF